MKLGNSGTTRYLLFQFIICTIECQEQPSIGGFATKFVVVKLKWVGNTICEFHRASGSLAADVLPHCDSWRLEHRMSW